MPPETLPTVALRGLVVLPGMLRALPVGRASSRRAVEHAVDAGLPLVLVPQVDPDEDDAATARVLDVGCEVRILQVRALPDETMRILVEGAHRMRRDGALTVEDGVLQGSWDALDEPDEPTSVITPLARELSTLHQRALTNAGFTEDDHNLLTVPDDDPQRLVDQVASSLPMTWNQKLATLATSPLSARYDLLIDLAAVAAAQADIGAAVQRKVQQAMDQNQREYHLKEQIKVLRAELGDEGVEAEADTLERQVREAGMPDEVEEQALREVARLRRLASDSAEHNISRTWIETVCEVPWNVATDDDTSLDHALETLDADHHGLPKVKERILEYLAVRKLRADAQGAILCFVGAPGVGKTSLGRSIAKAMGRSFARVSLGGIKDESEIRGHRRTYIGALPGRIVQALTRAGTRNPVVVLDEIDKLGADFRGDPASALLEVLDPEQNVAFVDHYLDVPVDLSQVLFIATANLVDPIPHALMDRFEIIEIPGYTEEDKLEIARRFLLPRQALDHGLDETSLRIDTPALQRIIRDHTREAGLRNLNRMLANLARKVGRQVVEGRDRPARITERNLDTYLGPPRFFLDVDDRDDTPGVAVGLAWTPTGGDILFVECLAMPGKPGLKLTGSIGDVMKESAEAALSWLRAHHTSVGIPAEAFESALHLHVPAGAIPKDGPSAGVGMVSVLASRLTGRPVRPQLAMTGEITLRGRVLPVGGVKEKILAARRAGITDVVLPSFNAKDLAELPAVVRKSVTFHPVDTIGEVLDIALTPPGT